MDGQQADNLAGNESRPSPPSSPGATAPVQGPPAWPTVLGVIAIVFGCLGALGGAMTGLLPFFPGAVSWITPKGQADPMAAMPKWRWWSVSIGAIGVAVAALLLVCGIGLCRRRRWAPRATLTWAAIKIVSVVFVSVVASLIEQDQVAVMQQRTDVPSQAFAVMRVTVGLSLFFALAWGWALPVFFLIWFTRAGVKQEVVRWA